MENLFSPMGAELNSKSGGPRNKIDFLGFFLGGRALDTLISVTAKNIVKFFFHLFDSKTTFFSKKCCKKKESTFSGVLVSGPIEKVFLRTFC